MNILVTGASGFIGRAVANALELEGYKVRRIVRRPEADGIVIPDINGEVDWSELLLNIDCVVHCAARAHVVNEQASDPFKEYRVTNVEATERIVKCAIKQKVNRFVFLSSIGVLGSNSNGRPPFSEDDKEAPVDPYAVSKLEAEKMVQALCHGTEMEYVIVRPPLVYGPGAKGNFALLIGYVKSRLPLPCFAPKNRRSLIALNNLVGFIGLCADKNRSPHAANQIFLISDDEVVSTRALFCLLIAAYGKRLRLPPVPYFMMALLAKMAGKTGKLERMFDSLEVSSKKARLILGWRSIVTMQQQLDLIAEHDSNF